jgi:hypothetical protein
VREQQHARQDCAKAEDVVSSTFIHHVASSCFIVSSDVVIASLQSDSTSCTRYDAILFPLRQCAVMLVTFATRDARLNHNHMMVLREGSNRSCRRRSRFEKAIAVAKLSSRSFPAACGNRDAGSFPDGQSHKPLTHATRNGRKKQRATQSNAKTAGRDEEKEQKDTEIKSCDKNILLLFDSAVGPRTPKPQSRQQLNNSSCISAIQGI